MKEEENKIKTKNKVILEYQNEGIFLIFNKLSTEYVSFINEAEKEKNEKLSLLDEELSQSTFDKILSNSKFEDENVKMKSIIQDYYLYYVSKNEKTKRDLNVLENLRNILEMICNFQFGLNAKKNLTKIDLLNLIIWNNDYCLALKEFLFCLEYFNSKKYFNKKNIFKEVLKKREENIDIKNYDIKDELKGIKKGMEIILSVLNNLCLEIHEYDLIKNVIEVIPTMYNINQKYKLNCKELYFLFQIKYIFNISNSKSLDKNIFHEFLQCLNKYRFSYNENNNIDNYGELIAMFKSHIEKEDNKSSRYIIKILIQEYKKRIKYDKILDILFNILQENEHLMKISQLLFHEIISQYFEGTKLNLDKISNYNTNDHFLILISTFSENKYIEQILLEVFESKFNAHFMSYTNEINNTIEYKDLSDEKANEILKGENLEMFKKCIDLLENPNINFSSQRFLPNIVYCAYIKSYLYQFISYVFKKAEGIIDLNDVTNSLTDGNDKEFKTRERKVMEIYSFRILLNYLKNDFDAFKKYPFEKKYLNYKNSFKNNDSFDDQVPKIIEFCGRTIEDFINIKGETPLETIGNQSFYMNTFLSIKIVCGAINEKEISINANGYKEIWDYFSSKLNGNVNKKLSLKYNHNDMYINYFLCDILQKNLYNKISKNEFQLGEFTNDLDSSHLNNKTLSIIIYIIRFCLQSYSASGEISKEEKNNNYFYSRLIDYNSDEDIGNLINNNFIPGRIQENKNKGIKKLSLQEFCLLDFENKENIINEEPKIEIITIIMLRFLFYSHLFFANLLGKISDSTFNSNYSITDGCSCLRMLISLWDTLNSEKIIPGTETNKVQIFLNRVNKEISEYYEKCKDFTIIENMNNFEMEFNKYIIKCREEYDTFKLIYADKTMKAILQQNNFPLSYGDDFPYMKYFELISYPNIEDLKQKIKGKEEKYKLYLTQKMMEYDENLSKEKFRKIFENKLIFKTITMLMNFATFSPYSFKDTKLIDLIINNKNIMKKYYKSLIQSERNLFCSVEAFNEETIELSNISNNLSKKFLENLLNKFKNKNNYLYENIRRPMLSQNALNDESLLFDIEKISDYKSYPLLLSKYVYKDIFITNKNKQTGYIDFDIKIDYNNYDTFDIDLEEFEDELESIILPHKRLFRSNDYNISSVYNFDTFKGKNNALLNNFTMQYKKGFEYINCQEQIKKIIDINNNKKIIRIFIDDIIEAYSFLLSLNSIEEQNEDFIKFNEIMKKNLKNNLLEKFEINRNNIEKQIVFNFIFCIYNNLIKIINILIDKKISEEISLSDFITNLPDMYNISFYTKYFFSENKEYKIKHLYYIFEEFEKLLFPFILLNVKDKYKTELYDEDKENILNYFINTKEEIEFTIKEFFDILRKFISRYLISSDLNEEKYDIEYDDPLIKYLDKNDLWPLKLLEQNKLFIEKTINELKEFNFLVQHSVCLYQCLSGIKFEYDGNIKNIGDPDIFNDSENEFNFFKDLSFFNQKDSNICKIIKISTFLKEQDLSNSLIFSFYNLENNLIIPEISNNNKSFINLYYNNNGLDYNKIKLNIEDNNPNKIFEIQSITNFDNSNINNIQNITNLCPLNKNDIYCVGTNNSKLMIIKLKDDYKNIELIQDIDLPESCVNNIEIFNEGRTIIVANENHILLYKLKEDDNNFNSYEQKKDLNTENNTYIKKIDSKNIAAFISPNIINFYTIINDELVLNKTINDIECEINSKNQKQYKPMNLVGKNNDILAICSTEHNIYLINLGEKEEKEEKLNYERCKSDFNDWFKKHSSKEQNEKKQIINFEKNKEFDKEESIFKTNENKIYYKNNDIISFQPRKKFCIGNYTLNECQNNFVSIMKCYDDYILILDNTNKVIVSLIVNDEEKIEKIKYIGEFDLCDIICFTPFGLYLE